MLVNGDCSLIPGKGIYIKIAVSTVGPIKKCGETVVFCFPAGKSFPNLVNKTVYTGNL